ncbi:MAG: insulinase family protein [Proteobacteria bacterium]|nr:insulinase family protein [Pseudomonadota bacterium]
MKYTLANGLDVLLVENHRAPVVSMMVWVKAGSADEGPDEHGLAHLMEHMLFKGTARRGPGEISREVESAGGRVNAYTSFDQTVFFIDMASRFSERGLDILADMVLNPALAPDEYAREKEVVIEEIKRGEDSPARRLSEAMFARAYASHPYGRPVIGYADSVRNISRETAAAFHERWYKPRNMILIAVGDFRPEEFRSLIEQKFGAASNSPVPRHLRPDEAAQDGVRAVLQRSDVKTAQLRMAFHIPGFKSDQTRVLDVLSVILGQGRSSRLNRRIKEEQGLVHEISTESYTPEDPGLFLVAAQLDAGRALPALKAIMAEISRLARDGVDPEELERAKLNIKADFIRSRETMGGEARTVAYFEALGGDYRDEARYLSEIERMGPEDIQAAAARFLTSENMTVALQLPEASEPKLTEAALASSATTEAGGLSAGTGMKETVKKFTLKNGATLLVRADRSLPLVSLRAAFLGGLRYETARENGVFNLLAEVWERGTKQRSTEELARAVEDMAGSIDAFSGRNSFGLEAEFLTQYLDPGLDLFAEVLTRPALSQEQVDKVRPVVLAEIKRQKDQMSARTFDLYARTLYRDHPYGRDVLGTSETVSALTARDLRRAYDLWARPANMVLTVVGDVDPERIRKRLDKLFSGWTGRVVRPPKVPSFQPLKGPRQAEDVVDRAQAHLILGFPTPGLESPDRYPLEVLDNLLSGMGGRLFVELRDKRSLAYALSSFFRPLLGSGSFGLYIGFDPTKLEQVRRGLQDVITGLREAPVGADELKGAKEYILGNFEISLQTNEAVAANLTFNELYGLGYDFSDHYPAAINHVTAEDVQRVARKYLDPDRAVEVIVGQVNQKKTGPTASKP